MSKKKYKGINEGGHKFREHESWHRNNSQKWRLHILESMKLREIMERQKPKNKAAKEIQEKGGNIFLINEIRKTV